MTGGLLQSFRLFSHEHILILLIVAASGTACGFILRRFPEYRSPTLRLLGVIIAASELTWYVYVLAGDWPVWPGNLPLHLCSVVLWLTAWAAVFPAQRPYEFAYYWGLTGTSMALLTPDIQGMRFSYPVAQFFISHGLVVATLLAMTISAYRRPGPGSLGRAAVWLQGYAVVLFTFNAITGSNYMFLNSKPGGSSLLDLLGPWPLYLVFADLLGAGLFWLLWLPFRNLRGTVRT